MIEQRSKYTIMVLDSVAAIQDHIIGLRRHFHQHPELSFRETLTAAKIIEELKSVYHHHESSSSVRKWPEDCIYLSST